ncbi:MAG: hypothetical protein NZM25_04305 [Leptospiraceae bacterium]|nr:hypothetical protein [Leptospiraceae bacterium]
MVALVGPPHKYGYGHLRRMELLKKGLAEQGIELSIIIDDDYWLAIPRCRVLILDRRDTPFPPSGRENAFFRLAIDNEGEGQRQAHLSLKLLPHDNMNHREFLQSLSFVILPQSISQRKNRCQSSQVHLFNKNYPYPAELTLYAGRKRIHENLFRHQLMKAKTFSCYYGQSFFEALYLGKEIYLYSLTPRHGQLARFFLEKWTALRHPQLYFDGQGLKRLCTLVKQVVHDGWPSPTTPIPAGGHLHSSGFHIPFQED